MMTPNDWERAVELYERTRALPPGERTAILRAACDGNDGLYHEVESLLQQDEREGPLDVPLWASGPATPGERLSGGDALGPYRVESLIGRGGMGEVYRARDTSLGRDVALKVLPASYASDPVRLSRLEREASLLASISHPNIAAVYALETSTEIRALVMEFVEGQTLAECLASGRMRIEDAFEIARQMADALQAAHDKGIVHRDLKPANIKISPDGAVKILDFGLARLTGLDSVGDPAAGNRVATATAEGVIVGSAAYMSPEQARGRPTDKRSDLWAFGCVLYEMITGQRAFPGNTVADTLAAVVGKEPDWAGLGPGIPPSCRRLLRRCLEKDVKDRAPDIGLARLDLADALLELRDGHAVEVAGPESDSTPRPPRGLRQSPIPVALAIALTIALAGLAAEYFRRPSAADPVSFLFSLPGDMQSVGPPVVSPDGRLIALMAEAVDGTRRIWLRPLDALEPRLVPGTESTGEDLFWSPDSRSIAFSAGRTLKAVNVTDGTIRTICELSGNMGGGTWNSAGLIVFSRFARGLFVVSASGGSPRPLMPLGSDEYQQVLPTFLPDDRRLLYIAARRDRDPEARVIDLNGVRLASFPLEPSARVAYLGPSDTDRRGHFLFTRGSSVITQPVDDATLTRRGESKVLVDGFGEPPMAGTGGSLISVSRTGTLVTRQPPAPRPTSLVWFGRDGTRHEGVGDKGVYGALALSPDGSKAAVSKRVGTDENIWLIDLTRNVSTRLTSGRGPDGYPAWAPDSRRVSFRSAGPAGGLFARDIADPGSQAALAPSLINGLPNDISPDGKLLLLTRTQNRDDLWTVAFASQSSGVSDPAPFAPSPLATETRGAFFPVILPGGQAWVAYSSDESGRHEIYVESFPRGAQKDRISTDGGLQPRWRRDGGELFYLSPDRRLMAVRVTVDGPKLVFGPPVELFHAPVSLQEPLPHRVLQYDVANGGRRFLISTDDDPSPPSPPPITVLLNWRGRLND